MLLVYEPFLPSAANLAMSSWCILSSPSASQYRRALLAVMNPYNTSVTMSSAKTERFGSLLAFAAAASSSAAVRAQA